jgi:predicted GIY-YIG superfamily endonuclease
MPHTPIDYANTVIYKIVSNDLTITDSYIGHTTDFRTRKWQHKYSCITEKARGYNYKLYKFIRENGGWDSFSMVFIETYPCKDTHEATARERYWYETLNSQLNAILPQRSRAEYLVDNKDIIRQQEKVYRETHRDIIHQRNGEIITCECGSSFVRSYLARHKRTKSHLSYTTPLEI